MRIDPVFRARVRFPSFTFSGRARLTARRASHSVVDATNPKFSLAEIRNRHARTAGFALGPHRGLRPVRLAAHRSPSELRQPPTPSGQPALTNSTTPRTTAATGATSTALAGATGTAAKSTVARAALSSFNIIVHPNDTLDAIFRRLKLNLADLASLRALPGLKAHLDSLHPGESLHFMQRDDGALVGLERRLNEEQTLSPRGTPRD